jgi:hypothetical protein
MADSEFRLRNLALGFLALILIGAVFAFIG